MSECDSSVAVRFELDSLGTISDCTFKTSVGIHVERPPAHFFKVDASKNFWNSSAGPAVRGNFASLSRVSPRGAPIVLPTHPAGTAFAVRWAPFSDTPYHTRQSLVFGVDFVDYRSYSRNSAGTNGSSIINRVQERNVLRKRRSQAGTIASMAEICPCAIPSHVCGWAFAHCTVCGVRGRHPSFHRR